MTAEDILKKIKNRPVAVAGVVVGLIALVMLNLRGGLIETARQELTEREREWGVMQNNQRRSADLVEHVEKIQQLDTELRSRLMDAEEIAINYDYFFRMEQEAGVRILSINQLAGTANPGSHLEAFKEFIVLPYNLSVQGSFAEILAFLEAIESGHYLIRIDSVTYSRAGGNQQVAADPGQLPVTASLKLLILGKKA